MSNVTTLGARTWVLPSSPQHSAFFFQPHFSFKVQPPEVLLFSSLQHTDLSLLHTYRAEFTLTRYLLNVFGGSRIRNFPNLFPQNTTVPRDSHWPYRGNRSSVKTRGKAGSQGSTGVLYCETWGNAGPSGSTWGSLSRDLGECWV